jgi:hypothetical protein
VDADLWPVGLRCRQCGHEWSLARQTFEDAARDPAPWPVNTTSVVRPFAACRHCAGLITLDVSLDLGRLPQASRYACPHCGAAGQVTLPGAVVRSVEAVAALPATTALASCVASRAVGY